MVDVKKPDTSWKIHLTLPNEDCPFLFYPTNIWGCSYESRLNYAECSEEICPIKLRKQTNNA